MNLELLKDAFDIYKIEEKIRKRLMKAILENDKQGISDNQRRFIKVSNITNEKITEVLDKLSYEEISDYSKKTLMVPEYHELNNFFILLLQYKQLLCSKSNVGVFNDHKETLYYEVVRWYVENHFISDNQREKLIRDTTEITKGIIGVRNVLSNKEEISKLFSLNIRNEIEAKLLFNMFVKEVEFFVIIMNGEILKNCLSMGKEFSKPLMLKLVTLNIITKEYSLGFSVEEYIKGYYERHDIMKEYLNLPNFQSGNYILHQYLDDLLLEVNDLTNEFLNQKKK